MYCSGLTHEKNLHKMRVLTFMSLGEAKSEVHFDDLCKELNISVDEIEEFIIEGTIFYHCILSCFLKVKWCIASVCLSVWFLNI